MMWADAERTMILKLLEPLEVVLPARCLLPSRPEEPLRDFDSPRPRDPSREEYRGGASVSVSVSELLELSGCRYFRRWRLPSVRCATAVLLPLSGSRRVGDTPDPREPLNPRSSVPAGLGLALALALEEGVSVRSDAAAAVSFCGGTLTNGLPCRLLSAALPRDPREPRLSSRCDVDDGLAGGRREAADDLARFASAASSAVVTAYHVSARSR